MPRGTPRRAFFPSDLHLVTEHAWRSGFSPEAPVYNWSDPAEVTAKGLSLSKSTLSVAVSLPFQLDSLAPRAFHEG